MRCSSMQRNADEAPNKTEPVAYRSALAPAIDSCSKIIVPPVPEGAIVNASHDTMNTEDTDMATHTAVTNDPLLNVLRERANQTLMAR